MGESSGAGGIVGLAAALLAIAVAGCTHRDSEDGGDVRLNFLDCMERRGWFPKDRS